MGHTASDVDACDGFSDDPNIVTIRSAKNILSNYYICDIHMYGHTFKSAEHAFQWKLCRNVKRDDLAEEILNSPTPEQAKEVASRVPSHLRGNWHEEKCNIMEKILDAKICSCTEFKQTLINSLGKRLVEAIKSDIFWSSGLNPRDSSTTKPQYYPGNNRLGYILERLRSKLLSRNATKAVDEPIHVSDDEKPKFLVSTRERKQSATLLDNIYIRTTLITNEGPDADLLRSGPHTTTLIL